MNVKKSKTSPWKKLKIGDFVALKRGQGNKSQKALKEGRAFEDTRFIAVGVITGFEEIDIDPNHVKYKLPTNQGEPGGTRFAELKAQIQLLAEVDQVVNNPLQYQNSIHYYKE